MRVSKQKKICIFLSAGEVPLVYKNSTLQLIELLVGNNYAFVYGGSERGLMKVAADRVRKLGGRIISVASEEFRSAWRKDVDELIECSNIPERKKRILEVSDAIVVLPGGTGTLDEFTEIVETKKWGAHDKPIILVNTDGFWNGLLENYKRMYMEGFLKEPISELMLITADPKKVVEYLNKELTNK